MVLGGGGREVGPGRRWEERRWLGWWSWDKDVEREEGVVVVVGRGRRVAGGPGREEREDNVVLVGGGGQVGPGRMWRGGRERAVVLGIIETQNVGPFLPHPLPNLADFFDVQFGTAPHGAIARAPEVFSGYGVASDPDRFSLASHCRALTPSTV